MLCRCGANMVGDGYTVVIHCETLETDGLGVAPDANPVHCNKSISDMPFDKFILYRGRPEFAGHYGDRGNWHDSHIESLDNYVIVKRLRQGQVEAYALTIYGGSSQVYLKQDRTESWRVIE
jgi:hypothetical protein